MTHYQTFIGVDIGKSDLVSCTHQKASCSFENNPKGWKAFYAHHKTLLKSALIIVETTGGYEKDFLAFLHKKKVPAHRANTLHVKHFIRSLGRVAKTDSLDAYGLALYGQERHTRLPLYEPQDSFHQTLCDISQRLLDINRMLVQEKNRLQSPSGHSLQQSFKKLIKVLTHEEKALREKLKEMIKAHPHKKRIQETLMEIPGIGEKISQDIICLMPELGDLNRKQAASLSGLAPHANESGTLIGKRRIKGGRCQIRRTLFMAAMTCAHSHSELGGFYRKLVEKGKPKMVALTALMRKIIVIANAKVRDLLHTYAQKGS